MKQNLLLDIDGVLADFYRGFANFLNEKHNAKLDLNVEPSSYVFSEWSPHLKGLSMDKVYEDWILDDGLLNLSIYNGAKDFVFNLADLCDIYIVTARGGDFKNLSKKETMDKIRKDTHNWFIFNKIPVKNVYFEREKINFCKKNNIGILVEDKLDTAVNGTVNGIESILINRNWNNSEKDTFHRVYSYDEALSKVKSLI